MPQKQKTYYHYIKNFYANHSLTKEIQETLVRLSHTEGKVMSQKQKIYRHYIEDFYAKHPRAKEIEKTLVHLEYQGGEDFFYTQMTEGMKPLSNTSKFRDGAYKVYQLSDGRVLECNLMWDEKSKRVDPIETTFLMFFFHGIIFQNMQDWNDYSIPMSPNLYWEG